MKRDRQKAVTEKQSNDVKILNKTAELTPLGRRIIKVLVVLYAIAICLMCFSPQTTIDGIETPNIIITVVYVSYLCRLTRLLGLAN